MCALVTGVQTCALPIFHGGCRSRSCQHGGPEHLHWSGGREGQLSQCRGNRCRGGRGQGRCDPSGLRLPVGKRSLRRKDRKSVVQGKRVPVRVALGGRRTSKNTIKNTKARPKEIN